MRQLRCPRSLTGRLVATLVGAWCSLATLSSPVVTSVVMRGYLNEQLDDQVQKALTVRCPRPGRASRSCRSWRRHGDDDGDGVRARPR